MFLDVEEDLEVVWATVTWLNAQLLNLGFGSGLNPSSPTYLSCHLGQNHMTLLHLYSVRLIGPPSQGLTGFIHVPRTVPTKGKCLVSVSSRKHLEQKELVSVVRSHFPPMHALTYGFIIVIFYKSGNILYTLYHNLLFHPIVYSLCHF